MEPRGFVEGLLARLNGPISFRFILQPIMALIFALRDGSRDAHEEKAPFFWELFTQPANRPYMLLSSWKSIGKVFVAAVVIDLGFQYIVYHNFLMSGGALVAGILLALVPYVLLRGPVNRLMRRRVAPKVETKRNSAA